MLHNFFGLSCFFHKPEKFRDKIRANTFIGENIGPDVKVLIPDVKVLVSDVKVLVPGCGSTGFPDVKVLGLGCESTGPWMCQIVSGSGAGKARDIFEKNESLQLIV